MNLIFGTTNKRKVEDLQNIINEMNFDIQVVSMDDIGWDRGEIEENGFTIEENSLIKAKAIFAFCKDHKISGDDSRRSAKPGIHRHRGYFFHGHHDAQHISGTILSQNSSGDMAGGYHRPRVPSDLFHMPLRAGFRS